MNASPFDPNRDDTEIIRATFRSVVQHGTILIGSICLFDSMIFYAIGDAQWWWCLCVALLCFPMYYFMDRRQPFALFISALGIVVSITVWYCAHIALRYGGAINFHYKLIAIIPLIAVSGRLSVPTKWISIILCTAALVALDHQVATTPEAAIVHPMIATVMRGLNFGIPVLTTAALFMHYFKLVAKQQALLNEHATTDPLTGLMNRRRLREVWAAAEAEGRRRNAPLSIALCDLDRFKSINDNHGHEVGDEVLCKLGKLLPRELRVTDSICRWGGEEFLLLLPNADTAQALATVSRIREMIADNPIKIGARTLNITVTIGVATLLQDEKFEAATHRADIALYEGKTSGRNRVVLADDWYPDTVSAA